MQLTLEMLEMLLDPESGQQEPEPEGEPQKVREHERRPHGRAPLPEHLPRVQIELLPREVQHDGLDAFVRVGEEVREVLERRPASMVAVRIVAGDPMVHTRDGRRTLLGIEPVAVGDYATLVLPDGLGLVARGSGLWTGVERTLPTCEVSRAVVAALPAPRGSLRAILPGAEHRGRSGTNVVDTDALFEAVVRATLARCIPGV